ncbi:helix-turn-helix transcriptional regulator [Saccharopolyspora sp. NPDC049357]|uniref:helix-turn-helix domain-containing protein n=1 Tax=Saccharopolyspora sp. NPDC049357 TaxID=3154507 RepID=UPI0034408A30
MPVDTTGMTPRSRALAAAIRTVREEAGISGRELSKRLGMSHGTISHWETGRRVPTPEDVASLLTAAGVTGAEKRRLVELARHASEPNWLTVGIPGIPQQLAGAVECERSASAIHQWSPMLIPGLLQTTDYARALLKAGGLPPNEIETRAMVRIARRETITCKTPLRLHVLVGENALRDEIGSPEVMVDQLRHLLGLMARDNVTIQVVPPNVGWHPGVVGPFVMYDFPDAPSAVHFEHYSSGAFVVDTDDVHEYRHAVDWICKVALSPEATAELIGAIVESKEDLP